MNTLQLAKIKQHLLQEIGDASAQPYDWDVTKDTEDTREYEFETDSKPATKYIVDLYELEPDPDDETNPGVSLKINFSTADEEGDKDYRSLTNKGELYRVMSTIAEIIKFDIQFKPYIKTIFFEPSRRPDKDTLSQNARANLYIKFITTAFPQINPKRDIENDYGYISVRLPDRFKKNKLQEIGDASAKDLPTVGDPTNYKTNYGSEADTYKFTTDEGVKYGLKIVKKSLGEGENPKHLEYHILFGLEHKGYEHVFDYDTEVNSPKNILKVMAVISNTIKKSAIKDMANGYKIKELVFTPTKEEDNEEDTRREKLYFAYITKALGIKDISSISKLHKPSGEWTVYIPEDYYFGISKQELDNLIKKKQ